MNAVIFNTFIFMAILGACASMPSAAIEATSNGPVRSLKFRNSAGEIVKDLITNWNSPILYLRNRGYLRAPQVDFGMFRKDVGKDVAASKESNAAPKLKRTAVSNENESPSELSHLFRSLFSSNDNTISDKIKLRLGVGWDMDKLKKSVRNEAHKFYESYYNKRNHEVPAGQQLEVGTDIDRQVAQLYPSVIPNPINEHTEKEEKKESFEPISHKETKFLNGIAKLLTNRELMGKNKPSPLQVQVQESKKSLAEENPTKH